MTSACALERVAGVGEPELLPAREVGVARPREGDRLRALPARLAFRRPRAHPPRPVLVIPVRYHERQRCPQRPPVAKSGQHLDLVRLDLLARAPAIPLLPAAEVRVDLG